MLQQVGGGRLSGCSKKKKKKNKRLAHRQHPAGRAGARCFPGPAANKNSPLKLTGCLVQQATNDTSVCICERTYNWYMKQSQLFSSNVLLIWYRLFYVKCFGILQQNMNESESCYISITPESAHMTCCAGFIPKSMLLSTLLIQSLLCGASGLQDSLVGPKPAELMPIPLQTQTLTPSSPQNVVFWSRTPLFLVQDPLGDPLPSLPALLSRSLLLSGSSESTIAQAPIEKRAHTMGSFSVPLCLH